MVSFDRYAVINISTFYDIVIFVEQAHPHTAAGTGLNVEFNWLPA